MSWTGPQSVATSRAFVVRQDEDEYALKMEFAQLCFDEPHNTHMIGYRLFRGPENYGRAMQAQAWLSDPLVQDEIARLHKVNGTTDASANEQSQIRTEIHNLAKQAPSYADKHKLYDLLTKVTGMQKQDNGPTNIGTINILKVPARDITAEDDADFERRFEAQQLKLVRDARSSRPE